MAHKALSRWVCLLAIFLAGCSQARSLAGQLPEEPRPIPTTAIVGTSSIQGNKTALPLVLKNATSPPPGWWRPSLDTSWQRQLTKRTIDRSFDVDVYDIDLFDNDAGTVNMLHTQGNKVICFISVGSWEEWRPDAGRFPNSVLGNDYAGWPGERWLDIRQIDLLAPIMRARLVQCKAKGFDGLEPDNVDGYANQTGFPLSYQDQLRYNTWLADEAHARPVDRSQKRRGAGAGLAPPL